jgi:hypothetical protein
MSLPTKEETNPSPDGSLLHFTSLDPREDKRERKRIRIIVSRVCA